MQFSVDSKVFQANPSLLVGLLRCQGLTNGSAPTEITTLLRNAEAAVRARFPDSEALKADPIIAAWQEAHRKFGSNPNTYPSSIHALCKRVVKGSELPSINTLVDLYNTVSLRFLLPVGGEDLDRCRGDIALTYAEGTEAFVPLGGGENEPPDLGEIIYKDAEGVLCRKFNWREASRTCLTEETANAVLVMEMIPPESSETLNAAMDDLKAMVETFCGGTVDSFVLDVSSPSAAILVA